MNDTVARISHEVRRRRTFAIICAPLALPWLRRHERFEMAHWSVHDLRRTARTNFSTLTAPHVAEIMLGHRLPGEWQVYDHYDYLPEQAAAYSAWFRKLEALTGAGPARSEVQALIARSTAATPSRTSSRVGAAPNTMSIVA